jgi:hypothetical protein
MIKRSGNKKYLEIDVKKIKKIANLRIPILPVADRFLKKYKYDLKEISVDKRLFKFHLEIRLTINRIMDN